MEKRSTKHTWKKWFVGLAALLAVLFFMPTATPQAATKNTTTWKVKVNEKYSGTLTLDGTQWYLNCSKVNFKRLNYLRRIVHLQTPKGCKITTGYYYFNTQGRLDRRRTFHDLDTRIGSTRFKGTYCFGEVNGRLHQQYGWYRVGGVNYGIGPTGKVYKDRWFKGCYYMLSDGTLARNRHISGNIYVDANGRKCTKDDFYLGTLKKNVQSVLNSYGSGWSVYVKDLKTNTSFTINDTSMYPASIIKLFVMEATYASVREKRIALTANVKSLLREMITESDNTSYNSLIRVIGKGNFSAGCSYINNYIKQKGHTGTGVHHTLHPSGSSYQTDGLGSNRSSARDVGLLLERIYRKKSVSAAYSQQMLNLLLNQQRRWKIPYSLPAGVKCGNKTGETDSYQHDGAIVYGPKKDYIIVVFARSGEYYGIRGIRNISTMVYNYLNG